MRNWRCSNFPALSASFNWENLQKMYAIRWWNEILFEFSWSAYMRYMQHETWNSASSFVQQNGLRIQKILVLALIMHSLNTVMVHGIKANEGEFPFSSFTAFFSSLFVCILYMMQNVLMLRIANPASRQAERSYCSIFSFYALWSQNQTIITRRTMIIFNY